MADVKVQGYGETNVSLETSGNNDDKVKIRAAEKENGVVFYTSRVLTNCPPEDHISAQFVAMAALRHWDSTMKVGLGSYVNQELEKDWPSGKG